MGMGQHLGKENPKAKEKARTKTKARIVFNGSQMFIETASGINCACDIRLASAPRRIASLFMLVLIRNRMGRLVEQRIPHWSISELPTDFRWRDQNIPNQPNVLILIQFHLLQPQCTWKPHVKRWPPWLETMTLQQFCTQSLHHEESRIRSLRELHQFHS